MRNLIFDTAANTHAVGEIEEALRWGEPAYLTSASKSGSTVRIHWKKSRPGEYAMYFNCQTDLVETFRTLFPHEFRFEGHRALVFEIGAPAREDALVFCIAAALTYHTARTAGDRDDAATASADSALETSACNPIMLLLALIQVEC